MHNTVNGPLGQELWQRADKALPGGGIYMSRSARMAGNDVLPGFIQQAKGCRITDVDGREYIDFLCGNGPNLLGYANAEIDAIAAEQTKQADLPSFYPDTMVEFAEGLLQHWPDFDWAVLGKNGSDVLSLTARVMRIATGRPMIVTFKRAYHGFDPEFSLAYENVPAEGHAHVLRLRWNDAAALNDAFQTHGDKIAGIIMNPLDQYPVRPTHNADAAFLAAIKACCAEYNALLALDDVRHGFRLHPEGSHKALNLSPDLICLGKALANGYAVAALLGKEPLRSACRKIQFTASYMFSAVTFKAGLKTLEIYHRDKVFQHLIEMGERLKSGFLAAATATGQQIDYSGPATMPNLIFKDDPNLDKARRFAREAALRGAIFHPMLNWFLCAAHTESDIDEAISIAHDAFKAMNQTTAD